MAGIYLHIPFCKQACHYCDFHFSTSVKHKAGVIDAMCVEMGLRKQEIKAPLETIYFGGGTPSLLEGQELSGLLQCIQDNFDLQTNPEITLEANPDDITEDKLIAWKKAGINRLSIGVQSFFEQDLRWMNRAHDADEALDCIQLAKAYFDNISIDLIYGLPKMESKRWEANLDRALELDIPHLSCYALTVENGTALEHFIKKGKVKPPEDELAHAHYEILLDRLETAGYRNYEFSNFGLPGFFSRNNMAYWTGKSYLGIGPSAHSYDGLIRSWNVANNSKYLKTLQQGKLAIERESLSLVDRFNEMIMTRLRIEDGLSLEEVEEVFGSNYKDHLLQMVKPEIEDALLNQEGDRISVTRKGKFLTDGISSRLFLLNLSN